MDLGGRHVVLLGPGVPHSSLGPLGPLRSSGRPGGCRLQRRAPAVEQRFAGGNPADLSSRVIHLVEHRRQAIRLGGLRAYTWHAPTLGSEEQPLPARTPVLWTTRTCGWDVDNQRQSDAPRIRDRPVPRGLTAVASVPGPTCAPTTAPSSTSRTRRACGTACARAWTSCSARSRESR